MLALLWPSFCGHGLCYVNSAFDKNLNFDGKLGRQSFFNSFPNSAPVLVWTNFSRHLYINDITWQCHTTFIQIYIS